MITAIDKNTALVLIDLQKGILKMPVVYPIKNVLEKSAHLVGAFRKAGLPIVIVNVIPSNKPGLELRKDNNPTKSITSSITSMSDFAEIADEIKTEATDIFITKGTWNAFFNTVLHEELQKRNITGIVLAGVSTSIGVEGTARAAGELAYNISFATDAMTDMKAEAHQNSINIIFPRLGEVGTTADISRKLEERK
jgi:nicotinamidase-related amidase